MHGIIASLRDVSSDVKNLILVLAQVAPELQIGRPSGEIP